MPAVAANKMPRAGRSTTAGCLPDQSLYTWNGKDLDDDKNAKPSPGYHEVSHQLNKH